MTARHRRGDDIDSVWRVDVTTVSQRPAQFDDS
jgi:hypothetical protein